MAGPEQLRHRPTTELFAAPPGELGRIYERTRRHPTILANPKHPARRGPAKPAMWGTRAPSRQIHADRASPGMMTSMSEGDNADVGRAPICPSCGVTALPAETSNVIDSGFVCESPDCDAFGDAVES